MSTDLERDAGGDERIRKWLARTIEVESIDRFVIRHDTGAEVATLRAEDGGAYEHTERHLDELTTDISERIFEDAIGLGGLQRYVVSAYSGERPVTRLPIRQNAEATRGPAPGDPIDSEPPTEKGLLSQTMRHLEISERTHATAIANIFAMQTRMLREKDERISHLESRHWDTVVAAEQLVSDHHRRQLENRAADQKAEAMREVLGTFLQLAPTAVNKIAGRALLPEKTSASLVGLRALVGTLKAEQLEALKFVLTPAQLENFTEIVQTEVADEEQKQATKR
ncbi:MAG TPA: hypothetical protein VHJ20_00960 [Polyangia bacterium]|nr:hypothetical protein [Polyangia bacterium]